MLQPSRWLVCPIHGDHSVATAPVNSMNTPKGDGPTRRDFCARAATFAVFGGALGTCLSGCGGGGPTSPSNATLLPVVNATRTNGQITVPIDSASPLSPVGSLALVQTSSGSVLVGHAAQDSYVALASICTHQNCTINGYSSQTYVCPCHGSTFDINGRVLGGPAPSSLRQYPTQLSGGVLTISA